VAKLGEPILVRLRRRDPDALREIVDAHARRLYRAARGLGFAIEEADDLAQDVFVTFMTCKEVSTLVSTGDLQAASRGRRLGVGVHLAMCRHCRAFRRQLTVIGDAARALSAARENEPRSAFEADLVQRLLG
jgi:hypothetical protein